MGRYVPNTVNKYLVSTVGIPEAEVRSKSRRNRNYYGREGRGGGGDYSE